jgi:hypothetical protein
VGYEDSKHLVFSPLYCLLFQFHNRKSAILHSDINSLKSGLLHLTGQPYCKKSRSAKVKDGIINLILRNYFIDRYNFFILTWLLFWPKKLEVFVKKCYFRYGHFQPILSLRAAGVAYLVEHLTINHKFEGLDQAAVTWWKTAELERERKNIFSWKQIEMRKRLFRNIFHSYYYSFFSELYKDKGRGVKVGRHDTQHNDIQHSVVL